MCCLNKKLKAGQECQLWLLRQFFELFNLLSLCGLVLPWFSGLNARFGTWFFTNPPLQFLYIFYPLPFYSFCIIFWDLFFNVALCL